MNFSTDTGYALWVLTLTLGCGHGDATKPLQPTAANQAQPHEASAANQPAYASPHVAAEAADSPEETVPSAEQVTLDALMIAHFHIAAWARDALVYGDIDALRPPLRALAEYRYPAGAPVGLAALQEAARLTAQAKNLSTAAVGIATMARVCGECHRKRGLVFEGKEHHIETETPKQTDAIAGRMFRHGWAAQRLWEGLVAPSEQSWQAGAAALAHAPMRAPKMNTPASETFQRQLRDLRELGGEANAAWSMQERTNVYAKILTTCAHCHAENVAFEPGTVGANP